MLENLTSMAITNIQTLTRLLPAGGFTVAFEKVRLVLTIKELLK